MNSKAYMNLIAHLATEPGPMDNPADWYKQQLQAAITYAKCAYQIEETKEFIEAMDTKLAAMGIELSAPSS